MTKEIYIGTAGWSIPKAQGALFPSPAHGTHLERYAARLRCVEINSSFYRPHQPRTYERWASAVPESFRFSVKLPRAITHKARLKGVETELDAFFNQAGALGDKLGIVLVQLPPSFQFVRETVDQFFVGLRRRHSGAVALEPRHASWFTERANALLRECGVSRVAADPAVVDQAAQPGGDLQTSYFRLHGSPEIYYSTYDGQALRTIAKNIDAAQATSTCVWCVFDNTAHGAALPNAMETMRLAMACG